MRERELDHDEAPFGMLEVLEEILEDLPNAGARRRGRGRAKATIDLIDAIVEIARPIQPCNVRALAYQLFNRKLIPSMATKHTSKVSRLCVIARESGAMPWEWIVDQTRTEQQVATWANPAAYARAVQRSYRRNKWADQPTHVSVWSEKATVEGTIRPVLEKYEVPFQILHGWAGATPVRDAAQANLGRRQDTLILYVGDYDPSGMYMSEVDLPKRLARYSSDTPGDKDVDLDWALESLADIRLEVRRIALTQDDTRAWATRRDSRRPARRPTAGTSGSSAVTVAAAGSWTRCRRPCSATASSRPSSPCWTRRVGNVGATSRSWRWRPSPRRAGPGGVFWYGIKNNPTPSSPPRVTYPLVGRLLLLYDAIDPFDHEF